MSLWKASHTRFAILVHDELWLRHSKGLSPSRHKQYALTEAFPSARLFARRHDAERAATDLRNAQVVEVEVSYNAE